MQIFRNSSVYESMAKSFMSSSTLECSEIMLKRRIPVKMQQEWNALQSVILAYLCLCVSHIFECVLRLVIFLNLLIVKKLIKFC